LQSIVSRNVSPLETAVVTVTAVHGGDAFNVIPPFVELRGTIRTFKSQVQTLVIERFRNVVKDVCSAMGCEVEIEIRSLTPTVMNDSGIAERVQRIASSLFPNAEIDTRFATMGSEDMGFVLQEIPGCFIFIGSANPAKGLDAPHHHPKFNFDENVLPQAVALMAAVAYDFTS